jgi:hypothetical protein
MCSSPENIEFPSSTSTYSMGGTADATHSMVVYYFKVETKAERDEWVKVLSEAISPPPETTTSMDSTVPASLGPADDANDTGKEKCQSKCLGITERKTFQLNITEVKEVPNLIPKNLSSSNNNSNSNSATATSFKSVVLLDSVPVAQTSWKASNGNASATSPTSSGLTSAFWGDEFKFSGEFGCAFRSNTKSCSIVIFSSPSAVHTPTPANTINTCSVVGIVHIDLESLTSGKKSERWHTIQPYTPKPHQQQQQKQKQQKLGSIRILTHVQTIQILPLETYTPFLNLLIPHLTHQDPPPSPKSTPALEINFLRLLISHIPHEKDELAKLLIPLLLHSPFSDTASDSIHSSRNNDKSNLMQTIQTLLHLELIDTADEKILFRGNTLATKMVDQYMKYAGMEYLKETLSEAVKEIYQKHVSISPCCTNKVEGESPGNDVRSGEEESALLWSCEVQPTRLNLKEGQKEEEILSQNWRNLLECVETFWMKIEESVGQCPW